MKSPSFLLLRTMLKITTLRAVTIREGTYIHKYGVYAIYILRFPYRFCGKTVRSQKALTYFVGKLLTVVSAVFSWEYRPDAVGAVVISSATCPLDSITRLTLIDFIPATLVPLFVFPKES